VTRGHGFGGLQRGIVKSGLMHDAYEVPVYGVLLFDHFQFDLMAK